MLRFWTPKGSDEARERLALAAKAEHIEPVTGSTGGAPTATAVSTEKLTVGRTVMAFLPYLVVIVVFSLAKLLTPLKNWLAGTDLKIRWPGSDGNILTISGTTSTATQYTLTWLSGAGTLLIISGIIVMIAYRINPPVALKEFGRTVYKLRFALLTVGSVLGLAYVMNMSGQTITIGQWLAAGTGAFFAFLSPILGWVGTAVTGSDTSANALFATLQQSAAREGRPRPDPAGRRQHLRRRGRQDDQPAEPDHRRHRGRPARQGIGHPAPRPEVEHRPAAGHVHPGLPAEQRARLDAPLTTWIVLGRRPRMPNSGRRPRMAFDRRVATLSAAALS